MAQHPDKFTVEALTAQNNATLLIQQAIKYQPNVVVIGNEAKYHEVAEALHAHPIKVYAGTRALCDIVAWDTVDMVLSALLGFAGLQPAFHALKAGKPLALANKETLVAAGQLIVNTALEHHAPLIPVDSEHSAIFQCLLGEQNEIEKLYLTASGGPFRNLPEAEMNTITKQAALQHPKWNMGAKITIDSATMMNKGLEVIEAHWLFAVPGEKIEVLVHPQSIVHSMVQFADGSVKAQLGLPDMKLPIQYGLSFPQRLPSPSPRIDFTALHTLTFLPPDRHKFPCLSLAYEALRRGGNITCAMNAANELAVEAFLQERIAFTQIPVVVEKVMQHIPFVAAPSMADIQQTDTEARRITTEIF
jgi:1-deoxy-D-xylulose-5-phosphate reductoisomerase